MIQEELKQIIQNLAETVDASDLRISDECLFEQACGFLRGEYANKNKFPEDKSEKATQKQIDFLCKLNADFDADKITKKEAKNLIDKLVKERGKKK